MFTTGQTNPNIATRSIKASKSIISSSLTSPANRVALQTLNPCSQTPTSDSTTKECGHQMVVSNCLTTLILFLACITKIKHQDLTAPSKSTGKIIKQTELLLRSLCQAVQQCSWMESKLKRTANSSSKAATIRVNM